MTTEEQEQRKPERAMVVVAHADDADVQWLRSVLERIKHLADPCRRGVVERRCSDVRSVEVRLAVSRVAIDEHEHGRLGELALDERQGAIGVATAQHDGLVVSEGSLQGSEP